ncbi:MAG: copper resistance protein B [Dokdonella sp.]|uniref:copper resistance protein B n=1 Tax=Dokdonella sp. TaxID=2291710 RepID=UPI003F7E5CCA
MPAADAQPPSGHVAPPPPQHVMGPMTPAQMIDVMGMDDRAWWGRAVVDRLEYTDGSTLGWSLRTDYGGDVDRVQLRSEGERADGRITHGDVELSWSRAVAPYWNSAIGVRHDIGEGADRSWVAFGVQGLAPYWIEVAATAYVGAHGRTALRFEAEYEALLTQRWVLQPRIELDAYGKDDPAARTGSGLADAALGLRLRYEVTRGFAPYVGVEWARRFGRSADYARADGDDADEVRWVAGLRLVF